ncbi:MAG: potassium/proton antiporter [Bacteroidota bacterium]
MHTAIIDNINHTLIIGALLLLVSIFGSKVSVRVGFPTLIIFIGIGIITRKIVDTSTGEAMNVNELKPIAKLLGVITLTFILFSGGLETDKNHVYPIKNSGLLLSTLGVLCTAVVVGLFLYFGHYGDEKWCFSVGLLVGAIVSSTDAAAVFSILRSRKINLKAHIGPLLELESGSNDVMVYFLMTFLLSSLQVDSNTSLWSALPRFLIEMGIGAVGGLVMGLTMFFVLNRINLPHKSLYPILTLGMIFLPYGLVNLLHGSGYLAVYIAGITLGTRDFICRRSILKFYEGFGWLLQIGMFITLGLLVDLTTLAKVIPLGLALSVVLMLVARPLSVFLSLLRSSFTKKQKLFISWVGLRGAVPIVFATYLYGEKGLPDTNLANELFHLIFFIVLISVLVQGSTLYPLAKKLDLEDKTIKKKHKKHILEINDQVKKMLISLEIPAGSPADNKLLVDLGLPKESLIVLVCRDNSYFPARGNTLLKAYDKLFVVVDTKKEKKAIEACLGIVS